MKSTVLAVGIEPPLGIVNELMEKVIQLNRVLEERNLFAVYINPIYYNTCLVEIVPDSEDGRILSKVVIQEVVKRMEEFPVQVSGLITLDHVDNTHHGSGLLTIGFRISSKTDMLGNLQSELLAHFDRFGVKAKRCEPLICVGRVSEYAREIINHNDQDSITGWLLDQVSLVSLMRGDFWLSKRITRFPLRKLVSKRGE